MPNDQPGAAPVGAAIAGNPDLPVTFKVQSGDYSAEIQTCQASATQMYEAMATKTQRNRSYLAGSTGVQASASLNENPGAPHSAETKANSTPPDAVTSSIDASEESGIPTALEDKISSAISEGIAKGVEQLKNLLDEGVRISVERTPAGAFTVTWIMRTIARGRRLMA